MRLLNDRRRKYVGPAIFILAVAFAGYVVGGLRPAEAAADVKPQVFTIAEGESFLSISRRLSREGVIRSAFAFRLFSLVTGGALVLKPGVYELDANWGAPVVLHTLIRGREEVEVVIPEGATVYEIDSILAAEGVLGRGALANFAREAAEALEGRLFPDKYKFYLRSEPEEVVKKFLGNFSAKAAPLLGGDGGESRKNLILASLLEKEVPDFEDRKMVAGILWKRLKAGMPLQVDAAICYAKEVARGFSERCNLRRADFEIRSPYNTYRAPGLPPGPIGNPGTEAIRAALAPATSPYWYYLSDPKTRKTVFARTFEEHNKNRAAYLGL